MNYYNDIKTLLINNEIYNKVKDYSKERNRVITYFEIGRLLNEAGKHYGVDIIGEYSNKLVLEVNKKYNKRTLFRMRQFYKLFSNEKMSTAWTQLTWSHVRLLFSFGIEKINYYINVSIERNLSVKELEYIIKSNEYERLPNKTKKKIIQNKNIGITDLVKDPIIIRNNKNYEIISENILQRLILEDISSFLKQLGNGFTFIDNEFKIKIGDRYNYIDLLLYNIKYRCYIVIELKVTELKKEHIGQIEFYMNYIDKNIKTIEEDKTIGIILCKEGNELVMEYCSDNRIFNATYLCV